MGRIPKFSRIEATKFLARQTTPQGKVILTDSDEIWDFFQTFHDRFVEAEAESIREGAREEARYEVTMITETGTVYADLLVLPDLIHIKGGEPDPKEWSPDPEGTVWQFLESRLPS